MLCHAILSAQWFLDEIRKDGNLVQLVGVHSHLGSTITKVEIFRDAALIMCDFIKQVRASQAGRQAEG